MTAPHDQPPDDIQAEIDQALAAHHDDQQQLDQADAAHHFATAVERRAYDIRVTEAARRKLSAEQRADTERPQLVTLQDLLQRQYDTPTYRLADLWPTGGRMLLAAQWKAGKSTLVGNLVRALVDGDQFLGHFTPRQANRVILIDDELDERTLQLWFREQHITNTDRVTLLPLRGRVAAFDILDPDSRAEWAKDIHGHDVALLDCLRPIFDALGLDENHEAGRFLVALDALLLDAGVQECGVVHHMGHQNERSRGDSRLLDWPDALWKIVRDKDDDDANGHADDPAGSRYFSAYGRDVEVAQTELIYNSADRRLTLGTKTRHQAVEHRKILQADQAVLAAVTATPGITKNKLRNACRNYGVKHNPHVDEAVERLVEDGYIVRQINGPSHLHYPGKDIQTLIPPPGMPNRAQGTPNPPLTSQNAATVPNLWDHPMGTVEQTRASEDETATVPNRAHTVPGHTQEVSVPSALKGLGTPPKTRPDRAHANLGTPQCPHCDFNQLPDGADMCDECADRLIRESEPDD
jgi:hypothetical protein